MGRRAAICSPVASAPGQDACLLPAPLLSPTLHCPARCRCGSTACLSTDLSARRAGGSALAAAARTRACERRPRRCRSAGGSSRRPRSRRASARCTRAWRCGPAARRPARALAWCLRPRGGSTAAAALSGAPELLLKDGRPPPARALGRYLRRAAGTADGLRVSGTRRLAWKAVVRHAHTGRWPCVATLPYPDLTPS